MGQVLAGQKELEQKVIDSSLEYRNRFLIDKKERGALREYGKGSHVTGLQRTNQRVWNMNCGEGRVLTRPQQINAGRGVRGRRESNPFLCATVQDFPDHVCASIN
jgi:hypothetical protein